MSTIDATFQSLRASGRKAFIPFITAGDPDLEFTQAALEVLADSGAAICEVGIPYSDPIADGPVIQDSYSRALAQGVSLSAVAAALADVAPRISAPLVTMISYSIVHRVGIDRFAALAAASGVAGAIVPDLPVEESRSMLAACRDRDISLIQLVTPTTSERRAAEVLSESTGFIYCVSVTGITGERTLVPEDLVHRIEWLRSMTDLPICVGFGVSTAEQAKTIAPLADGVIVGSALVRRVASAADRSRQEVLTDLREFTQSMVGALA
jgi:tryptophan synthase alpha chain